MPNLLAGLLQSWWFKKKCNIWFLPSLWVAWGAILIWATHLDLRHEEGQQVGG